MFIPSILHSPPQTPAKLCALNLFFGRGNELQICHGNILLMDNKHGKLFVIKQSKGCKFMPKMHQNMFRGRPPTSTGDAEGSEGRREGTGRDWKGREGNSPPPRCEGE